MITVAPYVAADYAPNWRTTARALYPLGGSGGGGIPGLGRVRAAVSGRGRRAHPRHPQRRARRPDTPAGGGRGGAPLVRERGPPVILSVGRDYPTLVAAFVRMRGEVDVRLKSFSGGPWRGTGCRLREFRREPVPPNRSCAGQEGRARSAEPPRLPGPVQRARSGESGDGAAALSAGLGGRPGRRGSGGRQSRRADHSRTRVGALAPAFGAGILDGKSNESAAGTPGADDAVAGRQSRESSRGSDAVLRRLGSVWGFPFPSRA